MARKITTSKTPAQRREEAETMQAHSVAQVEALRESGAATEDDPHGILAAVVDYLDELGWAVRFEKFEGPANGFATVGGSQQVMIDTRLSPIQAAAVIQATATKLVDALASVDDVDQAQAA